jgi:hypothetical protein
MQGQPPKKRIKGGLLTAEDIAEDLEIKEHLIALLESDSSEEDKIPSLLESDSSSDEIEDEYRTAVDKISESGTKNQQCNHGATKYNLRQQLLSKENNPLRVEDPVYRFLKRSNMYLRTIIDAAKVREDHLHQQLSAMKKGSSANVKHEQITNSEDDDDEFSSDYDDIPVELLQAELERRQRSLIGISAKTSDTCTS